MSHALNARCKVRKCVLNTQKEEESRIRANSGAKSLSDSEDQLSIIDVDMDYTDIAKIVLVGDSGVGKTCILQRFAGENLQENHLTTIGVDFVS